MASKQKTTKITVNTAEAQNDLKKMREHLRQTREEYRMVDIQAKQLSDSLSQMTANLDKLEKEGKKNTVEFQKLEAEFNKGSENAKELKQYLGLLLSDIKADTNAIKYLDDQLSVFDSVVKNLATSSLRQLNAATRESQKNLRNMSSSSSGLDQMHEKMDKLAHEAKIVKGEFVNVGKGLNELSQQSDRWLAKAIRTQEDTVATLRKTDAEYEEQLAILKQLHAEQDSRKGTMGIFEAQVAAYDKNASASDLRRAKATLTEARDNTPQSNEAQLEQFNRDLAEIEKRISGVGISWQKMRQVLREPMRASAEDVKKTMDAIQQKIQQLPVGSARAADLRKQFELLDKTLKDTKKDVVDVNDVIRRSKTGKASIEELRKAYKQLEEELNQFETSSHTFKNRQQDLKDLKKQIDEVTGTVHKQSSAWQTALKNMVAYTVEFAVFGKMREMLTGIINLNFKYSDSLADIRKVSGLAMKDVETLSTKLAKIDSRTSLEGLTKLAYQGSRLGFGEMGIEALYQFAAASDRVAVALHEDLGDDAMMQLSKMTQVMGEIEKHGGNVSQAFDAVSSSIFKLASTSTANGANIMQFAERLTGLSKACNVTTDQLLGLASASDAMMLMPEVASTAFNKLITSLQTSYKEIEKDLKLPEDTLKSMLEAKDTMGAIVTILENMSDGNMNSLDFMFKDLGSDGARLKNVMVTMAQNIDMLKTHLQTSADAYKDATAVQKEYAIQQETAQAILERANNMWEKAFVNPDGVNAVKEMAKAWYDFSKGLTQSEPFLFSVKALLIELKVAVQGILFFMPALVAYLGTRGLIAIFTKLIPLMMGFTGGGLVAFFGHLTAAVGGSTVAMGRLLLGWRALSVAMKANIFGLALSAVVELYFAFDKLTSKVAKAKGAILDFKGDIERAEQSTAAAEAKVRRYAKAIEDAANNEKMRVVAIRNFNKEFGPYLRKLLSEKATAQQLADAYAEVVRNMRMKALMEAKQQSQSKVDQKYVESRRRANAFEDLTKNTDNSQYNRDWLEQYIADARKAGKQWQQVAKEIGHKLGGMTDLQIGNIIQDNAGQDVLGNVRVGKSGLSRKASTEEKQLHAAIRTVLQSYAADNAQTKLDHEYGVTITPETEPTKEEFTDKPEKTPKTGSGGNPDKKEEQIAKDRANALIANIKAFYEEQERAYLEWVAKMNETEETVTKEEQARRISEFEENKKRALGTARQSIATLGTEWETYLKDELPKHMFNKDDEVSKQLMEAMGKSDIKGLHALFEKLSGDLSRENNRTLSENLGALLDQIFANGSKELREAAEKLLERQRELYAILNRDKFVDNVNQQTRGNLDKWQFLTPANGIDANTEQGQRQLSQGFRELISKTRSQVHDLYEMLLVEDEKKFEDQMHAFLAAATQNFDFSNIKGKELHALLLMLIDDERNYEKALKDTDAQMKQRNDEAWLKDPRNKAYTESIRDMENALTFQKLYGRPKTNIKGYEDPRAAAQKKRERDKPNGGAELQTSWRGVGEGMGFEFKIDNDPELLLIEERMKREREAFMEKQRLHELGKASDEEYNESLKTYLSSLSAYSDRVLQDISSQTDALMSFMSPIMSFGEAVGDAFATMREDAAQGKKAMQNALKQMIKSFATQSLQLIMKNEQEQANMAMHYATMIAMRTAFGQAELQAEQANAAAMLATQSANNAAEVNLEAIKEQQKVALRSAGIFGWCVSTLGPIAGPIAYSAMMATLMGLLNYALSFIGSSSDSKAGDGAKTNTKLVSGMLTYDQGNVQTVIGDDGKVYNAVNGEIPAKGVNILTQPTVANVNGQKSLIAEQGPELVIGRETTRALMMRPDLLQQIKTLDNANSGRVLHRYDTGNVSQVIDGNQNTLPLGGGQGRDDAALLTAITALLARLNEPIVAKIDMYGRGNLYDSMTKANQFMKGKS